MSECVDWIHRLNLIILRRVWMGSARERERDGNARMPPNYQSELAFLQDQLNLFTDRRLCSPLSRAIAVLLILLRWRGDGALTTSTQCRWWYPMVEMMYEIVTTLTLMKLWLLTCKLKVQRDCRLRLWWTTDDGVEFTAHFWHIVRKSLF